MVNSPSTPYVTLTLLLMLLCPTFTSFQVLCTPEETRYITSLAWNGEYWLIGTSDGWLIRFNGSRFRRVGRVPGGYVHPGIKWTGECFLGICGIYYCKAFAYDGRNLTIISASDIEKAEGFDKLFLLLNRLALYPISYSLIVWKDGLTQVLASDAYDLLPSSERMPSKANLSIELIGNGSSVLIYLATGVTPGDQALYLYDGKEMRNLSSLIPYGYVLWQGATQIWGQMSNGTHWFAPASHSLGSIENPVKIEGLFFFDGRKFVEVRASKSLLNASFARGCVVNVAWNGKYWLIVTDGRILKVEGCELKLVADLSHTLNSPPCSSIAWNGKYWLISFVRSDEYSYLLKLQDGRWEFISPPEILSHSQKDVWAVIINEIRWGDGRWLICVRERGWWGTSKGNLLSFDGEKFEDLTVWVNEVIKRGKSVVVSPVQPTPVQPTPSNQEERRRGETLLPLVISLIIIIVALMLAKKYIL